MAENKRRQVRKEIKIGRPSEARATDLNDMNVLHYLIIYTVTESSLKLKLNLRHDPSEYEEG